MVRETTAKSLIRRTGGIDSWFISSMGMNLYRGCAHDCSYCDGRSERYRVEGDFQCDITAKINAPALLDRELDPTRRRKPFAGGYVFLGGGVSDSYQPAEERYRLARCALERIYRYYHPVHILTKSTLAERDIDLIEAVHRRRGAVVSVSISTVNDDIAAAFEPGLPRPAERLAMLSRFAARGIPCGVYLLPVLPFISDTPVEVAGSIAAAQRAGASFIVFGTMTLKPGRQTDHFRARLRRFYPEKADLYEMIYGDSPWGNPSAEYRRSAAATFHAAAGFYGVSKRMPAEIFASVVNRDELICIILDQIGGLSELVGERSPYSYAARSLAAACDGSGDSIAVMGSKLNRVKGVGPQIRSVIREILATGSAERYRRLLRGTGSRGIRGGSGQ